MGIFYALIEGKPDLMVKDQKAIFDNITEYLSPIIRN